MSDRLGGKPWIANVISVVFGLNAAATIWLQGISFPRLDAGAAVTLALGIGGANVAYGWNARRVKEREIEFNRTVEEVEDA
jgi:hypothetical protein